MSQEFNRTESRTSGTLFKLYEFFLNPKVRTQSGTVLGTFGNTNVEKKESNGDRSQNDLHTELVSSARQSHHSVDSDPDEALHIASRWGQEFEPCHHIETCDLVKHLLLRFSDKNIGDMLKLSRKFIKVYKNKNNLHLKRNRSVLVAYLKLAVLLKVKWAINLLQSNNFITLRKKEKFSHPRLMSKFFEVCKNIEMKILGVSSTQWRSNQF